METALLSSALTGFLTISTICCAKTKCYCRRNDDKPCQYGCGFTKKSLLSDGKEEDNELRIQRINGLDVMYIRRRGKWANSEDSNESDTD